MDSYSFHYHRNGATTIYCEEGGYQNWTKYRLKLTADGVLPKRISVGYASRHNMGGSRMTSRRADAYDLLKFFGPIKEKFPRTYEAAQAAWLKQIRAKKTEDLAKLTKDCEAHGLKVVPPTPQFYEPGMVSVEVVGSKGTGFALGGCSPWFKVAGSDDCLDFKAFVKALQGEI